MSILSLPCSSSSSICMSPFRRHLSTSGLKPSRSWKALAPSLSSAARQSVRRLLGLSERRGIRSSAPEIDNQIMGHVMGPIEAPGGTTLSAEAVRINPEEWYPHYQSCMKHFLDVAQYTQTIQALAAFLNIRLPCQRAVDPVLHYVDWPGHRESDYVTALQSLRSSAVSLIPYIRRLVVTGSDTPAVLSAMFGESWVKGVGPLHSQERINYLFAAKSGGWLSTKSQYDQSAEETVPFLRPLCNAQEYEIREAETRWSEWLAMEDWMLGARSPWAGEEA